MPASDCATRMLPQCHRAHTLSPALFFAVSTSPLIAAIEAGGTKFNIALATSPHNILASTRIETGDPRDTLRDVIQWLSNAARKHGAIQAIGIGSFGPLDLDESSETYGYITTTPKPGWQHVALVEPLRARFQVPVGFDTDVNAAAIGEHLWGAGQGIDPLVYVTVGTGIGGGVLMGGSPLHGLLHPEIGHLLVPPPQTKGVLFDGCHCPFHHSCMEGFASGAAIAARWGLKAEDLHADHPAWEEVATVLAAGMMNITLTLSPRRIILGGGVMQQPGLRDLVRSHTVRLLNGYITAQRVLHEMDQYLVAPGLGDSSGLCGALALGMDALARA
jgi:fructokinase